MVPNSAHNPERVAATIKTVKKVLFEPHDENYTITEEDLDLLIAEIERLQFKLGNVMRLVHSAVAASEID